MRYRFKLQSVNKFRVTISILSFFEMNMRKVHVIFTRAILKKTQKRCSLSVHPPLSSLYLSVLNTVFIVTCHHQVVYLITSLL